jgi:hypothetical protein
MTLIVDLRNARGPYRSGARTFRLQLWILNLPVRLAQPAG